MATNNWSVGVGAQPFHSARPVAPYHGATEADNSGITTSHWKDQTGREFCANRACGTKFSLFVRYHHCRRCGDVFCHECLKCQRRLNLLAHPDPNGKLHKVCKSCHDQGPQTLGQTRSLLPLLQMYKGRSHNGLRAPLQVPGNGVNVSNFREKVDIETELSRLRQGFSDNIPESGVIRVLSSLLPSATTPDWQKAPYHVYGKIATSCSVCMTKFTLARSKRLCVVCGAAVCRGGDNSCSTSDLLVFVPDDAKTPLRQKVETALVKIVGCPPKEPKLCEYLTLCRPCRQIIEDKQVAAYHQQTASLETSIVEEDFWTQVDEVHKKMAALEAKVNQQLPKYQELIEALEVTAPKANSAPKGRLNNKSNTQVLAKAQSDIGDHLTTVAMTVQCIRRLSPKSPGQDVFLKNFLKAKCEFYQENMFTYRDLRRKLESMTPPEVLDFIQVTVDKNAINSCYIAVRQLAFETLHLCRKHDLDNGIVPLLVEIEDVIQKELQTVLVTANEPWDDHVRCVNELLQQLLTTGNHRLIRISSRRVSKYGKEYVKKTMVQRVVHTLNKIHIQINTKCADKSFTATKAKIKDIAEKICQDTEEVDWVKL